MLKFKVHFFIFYLVMLSFSTKALAAKEELATEPVKSIQKFNSETPPEDLSALLSKRHELEGMKFQKLNEIAKTEKNIELQKQQISEIRNRLHKRLQAQHQLNQFPVLSRLFSENTHSNTRNMQLMKFLLQRDVTLILEYKELLKVQRENQFQLKQQVAEIDQMNLALKKYDESIENKTVQQKEGSYILSNRGKLSPPVKCAATYGYGMLPNNDEVPFFFKGQFYDCPEIEKVKSIAPGRVIYVAQDRVNGLVLVVDHGGNFLSVYSGLRASFVSVQDSVTNEQSLGSGGDFEVLDKKGFYFELRYGETPLNPAIWVKN